MRTLSGSAAREGDAERAGALARGVFDALGAEYGALDADLALRWARLERAPDQALEPADAGKVLALLLTLQHGVLKYSHTVPGAHCSPPCVENRHDAAPGARLKSSAAQVAEALCQHVAVTKHVEGLPTHLFEGLPTHLNKQTKAQWVVGSPCRLLLPSS